MSITTIKSKFHQFIDTIEDKEVLLQFMEVIQYTATQKRRFALFDRFRPT